VEKAKSFGKQVKGFFEGRNPDWDFRKRKVFLPRMQEDAKGI
jgi:hypothetical protein